MHIFNLPDLAEGLPDAEIHEWFVKEGDVVAVDQPLVSMETAKAVVDVPCPQAGTIAKLFGQPGDVIKTGAPLVGFALENNERVDKGTVVGNLEESQDASEDNFVIGASPSSSTRSKASATVRMLAKKLGVSLQNITGTGEQGHISKEDVQKAAELNATPPEGFEALRGVRRAMLNNMVHSHQEVVPVSIFDEADIFQWGKQTDITVRLIRAIEDAVKEEPALNAWFNTTHQARRCFTEVNIGLAMDNEEGLFVPVLHDVATKSDQSLRETINLYKKTVKERTIGQDDLKGATITLSNFGKFAGRFASPIIVPPMVAIIAVGRLYDAAVVYKGKVEIHPLLPISLSFDHRAVTGGESTRFLKFFIESLQKSQR